MGQKCMCPSDLSIFYSTATDMDQHTQLHMLLVTRGQTHTYLCHASPSSQTSRVLSWVYTTSSNDSGAMKGLIYRENLEG